MDGGTSVMVCVSVECPNVKSVSGCVRAQTFASHFCLQPRGSSGCRLTHLSQADIRYQFSGSRYDDDVGRYSFEKAARRYG